MNIHQISLSNFRNYPKKTFVFSPVNTLIIGDNASGKTNLLEAVFSLATGGSFRTESDREAIEFGKEVGRVQGVILTPNLFRGKNPVGNTESGRDPSPASRRTQDDSERKELEVLLSTGIVMGVKAPLKKYSVNGVGKRMVDFAGILKVVLFWPQDMDLVTDSPSLRRRYLDSVLVQVDREYRRSLISYDKGLRQRNRLLEAIRDQGAHRHQLMFWDQLLIKTGEYITKKREEYIEYINSCQLSACLQARQVVSCQFEGYQLIYDKSVISATRLEQYKEEEVAAGVTLVGPHRDDFEFRIKNDELRKTKDTSDGVRMHSSEVEGFRNLSHFGSRGEQRLAVLWLKLGELAYIEEKTGEKPVLLLDDIFSELDHEHRKIIFEVIGNQQTIITTTDEHFIENKLLKPSLSGVEGSLMIIRL